MNRNWFKSTATDPAHGMDIVRISVAILLSVHGIHGLLNPADVNDFGEYLGSIGFPLGVALAWSIMIVQISSSAALILRRLVVPACIGHIMILGSGIAIVHAPHGWFVVGPGKNGVEYSIILVVCVFSVLWTYWPWKQSAIIG